MNDPLNDPSSSSQPRFRQVDDTITMHPRTMWLAAAFLLGGGIGGGGLSLVRSDHVPEELRDEVAKLRVQVTGTATRDDIAEVKGAIAAMGTTSVRLEARALVLEQRAQDHEERLRALERRRHQ